MTTLFEGSLLDISIVDENELSLSESSNSAYLTLLDKNRISKSILTKKINDDNILTLEFDISSNDTKEFIIDPALSRKILDIKNDINTKMHENIEGKFKSVLRRINNYEYIRDKIEDKIKTIENLEYYFKRGLLLREKAIKDLSIITQIDNFLIKKDSGRKFSKISNYFVDNFRNITNINLTTSNDLSLFSITEELDEFTYLKNSNINSEEIKKHLMLDIHSFTTNKYTADYTNFVIQNFVNNARSLYALMPNIIFEDIENESLYSIQPENELFIYIAENFNTSNIFDYITQDKEFSVLDYISKIRSTNTSNTQDNKIYNAEFSISKATRNNLNSGYYFLTHSNGLNRLSYKSNNITYQFSEFTSNSSISNIYEKVTSNKIPLFRNTYANNTINNILLYNSFNDSFSLLENKISSIDNIHILNFENMLNGNIYNINFSNVNNSIANNLKMIDISKTEADVISATEGSVYNELNSSQKEILNRSLERLFFIPVTNIYKSHTQKLIDIEVSSSSTVGDIENTGNINKNIIFNTKYFNSYYDFDETKFTLKIDNLIKKVKRKRIEDAGLNINIFNDVISNIKNSENDVVMLNFISKDDDNISVLNESNNVFKTIFNKEDERFNSSISYLFKEKVIKKEYKPYKQNGYSEKIADDITGIFSKYYDKNIFFSSSTYFKRILENFQSYFIETGKDIPTSSILNTELLYLSYFSNHNMLKSDDEETKDIVAKMFITKAIQKSNQSSSTLTNSRLKTYSYNTSIFDTIKDQIDKALSSIRARKGADDETKAAVEALKEEKKNEKIEEIKEQFYNSNIRLKTIKDNVFSEERINKISEAFRQSYVFTYLNEKHNINFITLPTGFDGSQINTNTIEYTEHGINWNSIETIFPFENFYVKCNTKKPIKNFRLKKHRYRLSLDQENNIDENASSDFYKSKGIRQKFRLEINNSIVKQEEAGIEITDEFENIFIADTKSILQSIVSDISKSVELCDIEFKNTRFNSEKSIIDYIESKPLIIDIAKSIMSLYSEIYIDIFQKILFDCNVISYNKIVDPYWLLFNSVTRLDPENSTTNSFDGSNANSTVLTDLFSKSVNNNLSNIVRDLNNQVMSNHENDLYIELSPYLESHELKEKKYAEEYKMDLLDDSGFFIIKYNPYLQIVRDIVTGTINAGAPLPIDFNRSIENQEIKYTTVNSYIKEYFSDLLSDLENRERKKEIIYNSIENNSLSYATLDNEDIFFKKLEKIKNSLIKSDYYQAMSFDITREVLKLSKNIEKERPKIENKFLEDTIDILKLDRDEFYNNIDNKYYQNIINKNIFNVTRKNERIKSLVYNHIVDVNNLKETFNGMKIFDFNQDIFEYKNSTEYSDILFSFDLPYNEIRQQGKNILLKITLFPRDIHDSDKIYLPIHYYICPNLVSINQNIKNIPGSLLYLENQNILAEDFVTGSLYSNNTNRNSIEDRILEIIEEKSIDNTLNIDQNLEDYKQIVKDDIILNHENSIKLKNTIRLKHDINLNKNTYYNTDEIVKLINAIPDYSFVNIFKTTKQDMQEKILKNDKFYEDKILADAINNLISLERDIEEIKTLDSYDKYVIGINENTLSYINLGEIENNANHVAFQNLSHKQKLSLFEIGEIETDAAAAGQTFEVLSESIIDRKGIIFMIKVEKF
jgi:hypothetical protein